jgi:hypothetical protein
LAVTRNSEPNRVISRNQLERLDRVPPVGLGVGGVVDEVGRHGGDREGQYGHPGGDRDAVGEHRARGGRSADDQQALEPLPGAAGPDQRTSQFPLVVRRNAIRGEPGQSSGGAFAGRRGHGILPDQRTVK